MAKVIMIPNGGFAQNCYLLVAADGRRAAIVDPGEESDTFLARIESEKLEIEAIWLTHAHIDHVLGVGAIKEATGAPIYLHPADRVLYDAMPSQARAFGFQVDPLPPPDHELAHGDRLSLGAERFEVRLAPGHSPGSVCLVADGYVLAGDVLFQGSIGRTDLPGGDFATLITSIREQLLTLPDETRVLSGHGPPTTIGQERRTNPFLTGQFRG
ncbi:MAG: MBL fold metallo-hydrolase [Gemmatimonadales bacterium]